MLFKPGRLRVPVAGRNWESIKQADIGEGIVYLRKVEPGQ